MKKLHLQHSPSVVYVFITYKNTMERRYKFSLCFFLALQITALVSSHSHPVPTYFWRRHVNGSLVDRNSPDYDQVWVFFLFFVGMAWWPHKHHRYKHLPQEIHLAGKGKGGQMSQSAILWIIEEGSEIARRTDRVGVQKRAKTMIWGTLNFNPPAYCASDIRFDAGVFFKIGLLLGLYWEMQYFIRKMHFEPLWIPSK